MYAQHNSHRAHMAGLYPIVLADMAEICITLQLELNESMQTNVCPKYVTS